MELLEVKAKNYIPGSMSFSDGFMGTKGDVGYFMVANYAKAKSIIENLIESGRKIDYVEMGLDGDWGVNSMTIYEDGEYEEYDLYEMSQWAEPIMIVNYVDSPSEAYSVWEREEKHKK